MMKTRIRRRQVESKKNTRTRWLGGLTPFARPLAIEPLEDRRLLALNLTEGLTEIVSVSSVELGDGDRTLIEIGGPIPGNPAGGNDIDGYDQIQILADGDATLNGTLEIRLVNDYLPDVGTTFDFLTLTSGTIYDFFTDAEGFWFPSGDRFCYFDIVPIANGLQLEVKEVPSDLQFEPDAADEDGFGEFLSDYFSTPSFTFSGSLSVPGFVELSGSFTISKQAHGFTVDASGINAFLGTGGETPETTDDTGFQVNAAVLGLKVFTPESGPSTYALAASGGLALVGLDGLDITGSATLQVSTHAESVDVPAGSGTVSVAAEVQALEAYVAVSVRDTLALSGELSATRARSGAVFVDIPAATVSIKAHLDEQGTEEVFGIVGGVRFSLGGDEGFRLLDMGLTSVSVFGVSLNAGAGTAFVPLGDDHPGEPADGFAVELTSLPGLTVDANLLNRRRYIDVTFFAPSGTNVAHASIDATDLTLTGTGVLDAQVSSVELLEGDTFRFHLSDQNTSNDFDLFAAGLVQVEFAAGSWQNDQDELSTAQTFDVDVRDGAATGTTPMSAGPLSIAGPRIGIEDLQFKMLGDAARLTVTVGIGAAGASLDFGGGQASSGVTVELANLLGTFELGADVGLSGVDNVTAAFGFYVGGLVANVPDVMIVTASDISVSYDPKKDTDGNGNVSPDEQQAYENRQIIGVGSVSIGIPKVGVTGTIENLSVRNNGFSVGEATLTKDGPIDLSGILVLDDVSVGVTNFGVTFGQAVDFDGEVFIASGGASLFPGKSFTATVTDANQDGEAVRCALTFTDGRVDGFKFAADQLDLQLGSYLAVTGSGILIDTGAAAGEEAASFASLGAKLNAGPLKLSGQMRNFAFLGDGSFDTKPGFGVFFNRDTADSKAFKWPSWMPIRITSVGARWDDINADPLDFQVTVSAALTGLHNLPLNVSGAVEGLVIDVGLLLQGKFPITAMESLTVGVEGKLFGGDVKGALLGGIVRFDSNGEVVAADDTTTPVEDRVLFVGLDAGFTMAGVGGFGLKMAFSELGPLGVIITASTPTGILLEPVSGLSINDFVAGVEFFKSLPALTEPEQLRDKSLEPADDLDPDLWLASVKDQVVGQYLAIQNNPNQAGFLTAFTEPMTITAGAKIYTQYTSQYAFNGQVELRLSTDGKFLATGKLNFFGGALSTDAKLYANLSEIAKGNATVLFLADIPDEFRFLVIEGKFQMQFQDGAGQSMQFDFADPDDTSLPVANLAGPANGSTVGLATFRGRGYLDVSYLAKNDRTINHDTVTDPDAEFSLRLSDGTMLTIGEMPTLVSDPEANPATYRYTYSLPTGAELVPGEVEIQFFPGSFADSDEQTNDAETEVFRLGVPEAELSLPAGGQIDLRALNSARYITVRFQPTPGAVLDLDSLLDVEQEIMLSGPGLGSVTLNGVATQIDDSPFFKYGFTGAFGTGPVQVTYLPGSFAELDGVDGTLNTNVGAVQSFTVVGPTAQLLDRNVDVVLLNERGYLDVQFDASFGAALVASSLTDPEAEFTLSNGLTVSGVPTNPSGDGVTWRYTFEGQFQPGEVTLNFSAGAWSDTLDSVILDNLAESQALTVLGPTIELVWPQAGMAGLGLLNQNRYIDVKFRPTWGNSLDESTVLDSLPELSLSGSAVSGTVTVEDIPEPLGDGVYRYDFTGDLQPGQLQIVFAAGAVQDHAGYASLAQTQFVTLVELTAGLAYPVAGSRVSAGEINDVSCRYLDVTFADPLGVGLDEASITDPEPEIEVWAKDGNGSDIQITVTAVSVQDGYYRYALGGDLPIGPVTVKYLAGSWADSAGNLGSAGEQSFLVTPTAANLSIYVGGSVEVFAGTEDVRLLYIGGEVLLQAESGDEGARVQVDMNGQIDLLYLGTVGAAAGRFVLDIPTEGDAGMWGVLRIDSNFQKLEDLGIVLDAYCLLEVNTTTVPKSETLTLAGQAEGGGDLTRTFEFGPEMFRIEAAGTAALHVPPFLNGGTLGTELACIQGALLLDVSSDGLEAFAAGQLSLGPPDLGLSYQCQGVLIINDDGFAAEVVITQSFAMGPVMQFDAAAHVTVNVTGQEQSVELPQEMLQYLPPMTLDTLTGPNGRTYVVPEGPPHRDGTTGAPGAYVVLGAEGNLTIDDAFEMQGDFWVEVSEERFLLDAEANLLLGPVGSLSAHGDLIVDSSGVRARVAVNGQLGSPDIGLTIGAAGLFEVNTTNEDWVVQGGDVVHAQSIGVAVAASYDFLGFAEGSGMASVTFAEGDFQLVIDGKLSLGGVLDVDVHAYVGIFDDDPSTVGVDESGVIVDAHVDLDLNLLKILDLNVEGRLQINTTGVGMGSYYGATIEPDGSLSFGDIYFVDANGDPTTIGANSFYLDIMGDLTLLGAISLDAHLTVEVVNHAWTIAVPHLSASVFGVLNVTADGWLKSTGEFELNLLGSVNLAWAGNGFVGSLAIHTALDVSADPDFTFSATGSGAAKIAGVTVAGAKLDLDASGDLGESIPITLTVEGQGAVFQVISGVRSFFRWIVRGKWVTKNLGFSMSLGTIHLPPALVNPESPPPPPSLGRMNGNILILNVGDQSFRRAVENDNKSEQYTITRLPSGTIRIAAFGRIEDFEGVSEITGDFGDGNDAVNLDVGPVNATIWGGSGNDSIHYAGSGQAILYGDEGDDELTVDGAPSPSSVLYGGAGNDTLINQSSVDIALYGQDGDDVLLGGTGNDSMLYGGAGNDSIRGRAGRDSMFGGPGVDKLIVEIGDLVLSETVDGGDGEDQIVILGDSTAQDLRVTMVGNVVKISSFSGGSETGSVTLAGVETVVLSGGEGADRFSVVGELELGGVTDVVVDMGRVVTESGQLRDSAADHVTLTLSSSNDVFQLAPSDVGVRGLWENHFALTVLGGYALDADTVTVLAGDGTDNVTVSAVDQTYGTYPEVGGPVNPGDPLLVYITDENGDQFGPSYYFSQIESLDTGTATIDPPVENPPLVVGIAQDESNGDYSPSDLSLREAIELANQTAGPDTITFAPGLAGSTITLAYGELVITDDLTINGLGAGQLTISGNHASRIFRVDNASPTTITVTISDLSLINGQGSSYPYGGAIYNQETLTVDRCTLANNWAVHGGAIRNDGALTITDSTLQDNQALTYGGGIFNTNSLTVTNSTLAHNSSNTVRKSEQDMPWGGGGGIYSYGVATVTGSTLAHNATRGSGGGIYNSGTLTVTDSTVDDNAADWGGGIYSGQHSTLTVTGSTLENNAARTVNGGGIFSDGTLAVTDSRIAYNTAGEAGGGICSYSYGTATIVNSTLEHNAARIGGGMLSVSQTLTVTGSTLAHNSAQFRGGGIHNGTGSMTLANSTLAYNSAADNGGAINNEATLTVTNSTLAYNSAGSGGGIYNHNGRTLTIANSIAVGNTASQGPDIRNLGTILAQYNVIRNGTGSGITHGLDGNQVGVDPLLDPRGLEDHGGPTLSIALLPGSPAIDAGSNAAAAGLTTDQRGAPYVRIDGAAVDVGAYELQYVVDTAEDQNDGDFSPGNLSLREAIQLTNATPRHDTIAFAPGLAGGTITLTSGVLLITDDLTITGPGASQLTISGNHASRILFVDNTDAATTITVKLSGLSLISGTAAGPGAGIYNKEDLTLEYCTLADNRATHGGAIVNYGMLSVVNSTISGNSTSDYSGGGIYNMATGTLSVVNSTIAGNSAVAFGGGIFNYGVLSVSSSTIVLNTADLNNSGTMDGGGIATYTDGSTTLHNTIVAGNLRGTAAPLANDLSGNPVVSGSSHNLIGNAASSGGLLHGVSGNLVGVDPLLDPAGLQYHGGPTRTIALLPGSPAIDAGSNAAAAGLSTDQRGLPYARIAGAAVDVGAYERQFVVDNAEDESDGDFSPGDLSLREAIELTNASFGADTIVFAPNLAGSTITLTLGQLEITGDLELVGQQITLDANGNSRVLLVQSGAAATIRNFTITGGNATHGGGIFNEGQLTVVNTTVSGNTATGTYGGGIYNLNGTLTIENSTISSNTSNSHAGGIANLGGTLTVVNSTIAGNTAGYSGGGIVNWMEGTLNVTNSTIAHNIADDNGDGYGLGGGIDSSGGGVNMTTLHNTIVAQNLRGATGSQTADDLSGTVETGSSFNLIGNAATAGGLGSGNGNQVGVDPLLDPAGLQNHGGPTLSIALLPGSPAIDAGNNAAAAGWTNDQRGVPFARIYGPTVDVGAYEFQPLVVDTAEDESDGVLSTGHLSLREAVELANAIHGPNTIVFHPDLAGTTITLTLGELQITDHLTISGPGASQLTISGNHASRIFLVDDGNAATTVTVEISGLSLIGGNSDYGGGIKNAEDLTVSNSTLASNSVSTYGGAIYNAGTLSVIGSTLAENSANMLGGGIHNDIWATLIVINSTFADNSAGIRGGGICNRGTVTVTNSTLAGNSAGSGNGGAIDNYPSGTVTIANSTLAHNSAGSRGGGIYNYYGTVSATNSTLVGNSAGYRGGGIYNWYGEVTVTNSTLTDNSALQLGGGICNDSTGTLNLTNSLLGGNTAAGGPDISNEGTIDAQHNLIQDGTGSGITHDLDGNKVGVDPLLDPAGLQDHGGPTHTIALLPGSPAVDAGSNAAATGLQYDQRGEPFARIYGNAVDVGAYEMHALVVDTVVDENNGISVGGVSLRDAVAWANANPGPDTILFHPSLAGSTVTLTLAQVQITDDLTIAGPGASQLTISGANARRIFLVDNADAATAITVHISGLTLANGKIAGDHGGAISNRESLTLQDCTLANNQAAGHGGAVYNLGALNVFNSTIADNIADYNDSNAEDGGGIYSSGTLTVVGSTISGNRGYNNAGGIFVNSNSTAVLRDSIILGNSADGHAGGIQNLGTLSVVNSTITNNVADVNGNGSGDGGGIYNSGTLSIENSTISGNLAYEYGGGIVNGATLGVLSSTISGNFASYYGGGIHNASTGNAKVHNSTIFGNSCGYSGGGILNWGGTLTVASSTIAKNTADSNSNGTGGGGGIRTPSGSTTLHNTIVAGNFRRTVGPIADDLNGSVQTSSSYNLIGNAASAGGLTNGVNFNQVGVDPLLDPAGLQNHGGPTLSIALLPGSPAIDNGNDDLAVDPGGAPLEFDQRDSGFPRIVHAAVDIGAFEVQNLPPVVDAGTDLETNEGSAVILATSFTDQWTGETHTATIDWGDGTPVVPGTVTQSPAAAGGTVAASHVYADNGTYTVTVTVTDDGGAPGSDTLLVTVHNVAPTVDAGADRQVDEASLLNLASSYDDPGTADTHTATIDWGDGTPVVPGTLTQSPAGTGGTVAASHVYADNGTYIVTVTVTDDDGAPSSDTLLVTVHNVAPTVEAGPNQEAGEGSVVILAASFSDPAAADTHTATINWGDGTLTESGVVTRSPGEINGTVTGSHVYADNGTYTVTVTVRDDDGASTADTLLVTVHNVAPSVEAGADREVNEGSAVNLTSSFSDAGAVWGRPFFPATLLDNNTGAPAGHFTGPPNDVGFDLRDLYTVTFDFGQYRICNLPGPDFNVYELDSGVDEFEDIRVYVSQDGVWFANVTATAGPALAIPGDEAHGNTQYARSYEISGTGLSSVRYVRVKGIDDDYELIFGVPVGNRGFDLDAVGAFVWTTDTHTATIDWGDGTPLVPGTVTQSPTGAGSNVTGSHVYADNGTYTVTVTVTDDDGDSSSDTLLVTVHNVAPTLSGLSVIDAEPGLTATLTGLIGEPSPVDTLTLTVDWGDGSPLETFPYPAGTSTFTETHLYDLSGPGGPYSVTIGIQDDDLGSSAQTIVTNVAHLKGAAAAETIVVTVGTIGGAWHQVNIGGNLTSYDPAVVDAIYIDGLGGNDTITILCTGQNETVTLSPGAVDVTGQTYRFHATNVSAINVDAGAGNDQVAMTGSTGSNRLYSYPGYSLLSDSLRTFSYRVEGFGEVTVNAPGSTSSYAFLYDSPQGDMLDANPDRAVFHRAVGTPDATVTTATGFERVYAYGTGGGTDTATLTGSETTANRFYSYPDYSILTEAQSAFYFYVNGFETVTANSPGGGYAYAYLYDSPGNDTLTATPTSAAMDRAAPWSDTTATGFKRLYAYSTRGGSDTADLTGSSGGNRYYGYPAYSTLTDATNSFYHYVNGFSSVTATGSAADPTNDRAYLYDSSGDDTLYGRGHRCYLEDTAKSVYHNEILYFDLVYATSSDDDSQTDDTIDIDDSLLYNLIRRGSW